MNTLVRCVHSGLLMAILIGVTGCSNNTVTNPSLPMVRSSDYYLAADTVHIMEDIQKQNSTTFSTAVENPYERPIHFLYAHTGGKALKESDDVLLEALNSWPLKPTMALQVILNRDPTQYDDFLKKFSKIIPNMFFGYGNNGISLDDPAKWNAMVSLCTKFRQYTDCISIEMFDRYLQYSSEATMIKFLTKLHDMGFKHIVANMWVPAPSGKPWPYVDGAFDGVRVDPKADDYCLPKFPRMVQMHENDPGIHIICNYENAVLHVALAEMGREGSIKAMSLTADIQNTSVVPFRWAPPWTVNYNPIQMKTLKWMGEKFAEINSSTTGIVGPNYGLYDE